jgi:Ca2+-binding EF-hand superfamily protein
MEALTHGQISQLEETFNRLDSRGAGTLSANDISFVLSTIGVKVAPHDVKPLLNSLGLNRQSQDGDVSVTFSAFVTLMSHPFEVGETDASAPFLARAIQKLFALTAVGAPASTGAVRLTALSDITDRELMRAFSVLDADGDGVLSYDDLIITLPTFDPAITPHHVRTILMYVQLYSFDEWPHLPSHPLPPAPPCPVVQPILMPTAIGERDHP